MKTKRPINPVRMRDEAGAELGLADLVVTLQQFSYSAFRIHPRIQTSRLILTLLRPLMLQSIQI